LVVNTVEPQVEIKVEEVQEEVEEVKESADTRIRYNDSHALQ
jgi:hypothetical protein